MKNKIAPEAGDSGFVFFLFFKVFKPQFIVQLPFTHCMHGGSPTKQRRELLLLSVLLISRASPNCASPTLKNAYIYCGHLKNKACGIRTLHCSGSTQARTLCDLGSRVGGGLLAQIYPFQTSTCIMDVGFESWARLSRGLD